MSAFEELLTAWRKNPDAPSTIALARSLATSSDSELVREIGARALARHASNAEVMLAVGRMYLGSGALHEAQTALMQAGTIAPAAPLAFRLLGEVLLRRGDAVRAERVLSRALELGARDAESRNLHDRAAFYVPLQKRVGARAVASEVERALAKPRASGAHAQEEVTLPGYESDAYEISDVLALEDATTEDVSGAVPSLRAHGAARSTAPLPVNGSAALRPGSGGQPPGARTEARRRAPSFEDVSDLVEEASLPRVADPELPTARTVVAVPAPYPGPASRPPSPPRSNRASAYPYGSAPSSFEDQGDTVRGHRPASLTPAVVLEHLSRVGVYEPGGGAAPAWEKAPKQKSRGTLALALLIVLVSGAGAGAYEYSRRVKAERALEAAALNAEVDRLLDTARLSDLAATDAKLARAFDLDSRSPKAARLWLENRVLGALLSKGPTSGIDSAVHRGRAVGLEEKELAAGRVASFLVEADLAGASALLSRWDREAAKDPLYQLAAGAVLERAGDARAAERYAAARALDASSIPADILFARLLVLEQGPVAARPVLDALRSKVKDAAALRALEALAFAFGSERAGELPESARLTPEQERDLPAPLAVVPALTEAVLALDRQELEKAASSLDRAIKVADTPALAASLGFLAIETGDEQLARKAALRALGLSALYPRARALAARVALLGGRIDEAEKAIEGLEATSADVAVVRAVAAYEKLEAADLATALEALDKAQDGAAFAALEEGPRVLRGGTGIASERLQELAVPAISWGELIAVDAALDTGRIELAETLLARRNVSAAAHLARRARVLRYQGKIDEALAASEAALSGTPTPALLIERTYELIEAGKADAGRALVAKYPASLGPMAGFLGVLLDLTDKQPKQAAVRLATLELPPDEAPVVLRVLAARALAAAKDKRAKAYVAGLAKRLRAHPDVVLSVEALK